VLPNRDRPALLRAALNAILHQEYPGQIDALVVCDQSEPDAARRVSDATAQTVNPRRRVRVIRNVRTPGLAGARNSGILAATGDLVAFCDDDDEWLPGKLTAQLAALGAVPGAEFACCGIRVSYDGRAVDRALDVDRVGLPALLRDRLAELHPSTFLIRRDALINGIGLVDEEIPGSYAEDYEFLLRAARRTPLVNVPAAYVIVRWHSQSYFARRWDTVSAALQWLLRRYPEFATVPYGEARVTGQIAFARAASGDRRGALLWVARTLARNPREPRAYLALAVASMAMRPDTVLRALRKRGRGI
jgi:glycosyltransferase involved in cell wall biosynthesis